MITAPNKSRSKLWIWLSLPFLIFAIVITIAAFRIDAALNHFKTKAEEKWTAQLGRPIKVGDISTTVLSGLGARIKDISVGADATSEEEKAPFLTVKEVRVGISTLPALLSLGKKIHFTEIIVEGLALNLVRFGDGTLNLDRIQARMPKSEPTSEETKVRIRNMRAARAALTHANIRFTDFEPSATVASPVEISKINLELRDVSVLAPFDLVFEAAILANEPNLKMRARLGQTPQSLEGAPPLLDLKLTLSRTDLSPLAPLLARAVPHLKAATAAADIDTHLGAAAPGGKGPTTALATLELTRLQFANGKAFDFRAATDFSADSIKGDVDLKKLNVTAAGMTLSGKGKLFALRSEPRFEDFLIETKGFNFDVIRQLYPALDEQAGATLSGPLALRIVATGNQNAQTFDTSLDLTAASIEKGETFLKPQGVPFRLHVAGNAKSNALTIHTLSLLIADLDLKGRGVIRDFKNPTFEMTVGAHTDNVTAVARLSPKVAKSLTPAQRVEGSFTIDAKALGSAASKTAHGRIEIANANLKVPDIRLLGNAHATLASEIQGESASAAMRSTLDAELSKLEIHYGDSFDKKAGTPMSLHATSKQADSKGDTSFEIKMASMVASGQVATAGEKDPVMDGSLHLAHFDTQELAPMLPSLARAHLPHMRIDGDFKAKGQRAKPDAMRIEITNLDIQGAKSDLHGQLSLTNIVKPKFSLDAKSNYLDLDDFLPKSESKSDKQSDHSVLKDVYGVASLSVKKGHAANLDYDSLRSELSLRDGLATAKTLEVNALGGSFSGSGTEVDLLDEHGPFHAVGKIEHLDLDQATTYLMNTKGVLLGKFSGQVDLRGKGTSRSEMAEHLDGVLKGQLQEVSFVSATLAESISKPVMSRLTFLNSANLKPPVLPAAEFKPMAAEIRVKNGAIELRSPLEVPSALGPLVLSGRTFLNGRLDFKGGLRMPPALASQLVGNTVTLHEAVPVKLNIGGTMSHPTISPADADVLARTYLTAYAKSAANSAFGQQAQKMLSGSPVAQQVLSKVGPVPTSQAEAEAAAKKAADEAKVRAEQAARDQQAKLEAEAKARADAARKQAEDRARQEADKAKRDAEERLKKEGAAGFKSLFGK